MFAVTLQMGDKGSIPVLPIKDNFCVIRLSVWIFKILWLTSTVQIHVDQANWQHETAHRCERR